MGARLVLGGEQGGIPGVWLQLVVAYRKHQSGNIYSFELVFDGPAKGEETSKPKLIFRDKEQPNYGAN